MARSVVCISHATGAGGEQVGRLVADGLGWLYVDEDIVARAADQGGLEPREVADEERRRSLARRIVEALAEGGGEAWSLTGTLPTRTDEPTSAEIRALIRETIVQTAAHGRVVIVAHAASHAIGRSDGALRVLVTASHATRSQRVADTEGLGGGDADRAVKSADAARKDYLRRFYEIDDEQPTHYDLVLNTDVLSVEQAAAVVSRAVT